LGLLIRCAIFSRALGAAAALGCFSACERAISAASPSWWTRYERMYFSRLFRRRRMRVLQLRCGVGNGMAAAVAVIADVREEDLRLTAHRAQILLGFC